MWRQHRSEIETARVIEDEKEDDLYSAVADYREDHPEPDTSRASHHSTGKLPFDLLPPEAMKGMASTFLYGASKYGRRNWEKGMALSEFYGSAQRHLWSWWAGEEQDPESEIHHLWHAMTNIAMMGTLLDRNPDLDDRPIVLPVEDTLREAPEPPAADSRTGHDAAREEGGATGIAAGQPAPSEGPQRGGYTTYPWNGQDRVAGGSSHPMGTWHGQDRAAYESYLMRGIPEDYCVQFGPKSDIKSIQQRVKAWADKVMPNRKPVEALRKLVMEEIPELMRDPSSPEEYADCVILILDYAGLNGIDVYSAVMDKMAVNENSEWHQDPVTGHYKRVK